MHFDDGLPMQNIRCNLSYSSLFILCPTLREFPRNYVNQVILKPFFSLFSVSRKRLYISKHISSSMPPQRKQRKIAIMGYRSVGKFTQLAEKKFCCNFLI